VALTQASEDYKRWCAVAYALSQHTGANLASIRHGLLERKYPSKSSTGPVLATIYSMCLVGRRIREKIEGKKLGKVPTLAREPGYDYSPPSTVARKKQQMKLVTAEPPSVPVAETPLAVDPLMKITNVVNLFKRLSTTERELFLSILQLSSAVA